MGPISQYILNRVNRLLDEHRVVVWYDPGRKFDSLLEHLAGDETRVIRFTGSYYRLLAEAEELFDRYDQTNLPAMPRLLLYIPATPLDGHIDVLMEISMAGEVFKESLPTLARLALRDRIPRARLEQLLSGDQLTLADLDRLAEDQGPGGLVPLLFNTAAAHEIAAKYLCEPEWAERVKEKGCFAELAALFRDSFGLPLEGVSGHEALKKALARQILLTEFIDDMGEGADLSSLTHFPFPSKRDQVECCRRAAELMRQLNYAVPAYMELAGQVEKDYRLREIKLDPQGLGRVDTFPFEEETLLIALEKLLLNGQEDLARELIEQRRSSFWTRVDPRRAVQWQAAGMVLELYRETQRIGGEIARQPRLSPEAWLQMYTGPVNGGGEWYRLDMCYRQLERLLINMEEDFALADLLDQVRRAYFQTLRRLNENFSRSLQEHGFTFTGFTLQSDIYDRYVVPLLEQGPVAYFLVDALRFEMGVELARMLGQVRRLELFPALATPPTITKVGMAALLPGASRGLTLLAHNGELAVNIGDVMLDSITARQKYLQHHLGHSLAEFTLAEISSKGSRSLSRAVAGKSLVVVRTSDIDSIGEEDLYQAHREMTGVLGLIHRAVRRLARAGVRRFVITADHGYLLGERITEDMKIDPPGGQTVELHRRCWAGYGGSASSSYLRFTAAGLGLGGDLELAFPVGTGVFKKAGGGTAYFHGGLSPAELVIPVLSFELDPPAGKVTGDRFILDAGKTEINNRIFTVRVNYMPALFAAEKYRVRCVAVAGEREIGVAATAVYGYDSQTGVIELEAKRENHITMMINEGDGGTMKVQLLDATTGVVLAEQEIPYRFSI